MINLLLSSKNKLKRKIDIFGEHCTFLLNFNQNTTIDASIHFITYGDSSFAKSRERILKEAKELGIFDSVNVYTEKDRGRWFGNSSKAVQNVISSQRGGGYWLWKPFCVYERLSEIDFGDVLIYADAGCSIYSEQSSINQLVKLIKEVLRHETGMMCFQIGFNERVWTKRDVYEQIYPEAFESLDERQLAANRFIIVKTETTVSHIKEWVDYAWSQPHLFDDSPSVSPNPPEFKEHRHDQSVFSLISKRRGCLIKGNSDIQAVIDQTRIRE